jgi:hypothetical protein
MELLKIYKITYVGKFGSQTYLILFFWRTERKIKIIKDYFI